MNQPLFQYGGSLPSDAPTYVHREADNELPQKLEEGKFCYVLTARQMGKSSLRIRTVEKLRKKQIWCASIDLNQIGTEQVDSNNWFFSILDTINEAIGDLVDISEFWEEHQRFTPIKKWEKFFKQILTENPEKRLIVLVDEIDAVLSLESTGDFASDDFFASIRAFYNQRAENPESPFHRLTFALFGVASPDELIQDPTKTPFNIGEAIALKNLTYENMQAVFTPQQIDPQVLQAVFEQSSGHPYLTQKILAKLAEKQVLTDEAAVIPTIEELFFDPNGTPETNFDTIETRLLSHGSQNLLILNLYEDLLKGNPVLHQPRNLTQIYLKLSGLVIEKGQMLQINNQIYARHFDRKWHQTMFRKIDRPFLQTMRRWIQADRKDQTTALRGTQLQEALQWKAETPDLIPDEVDFIGFSQRVEGEEAIKEHYNKQLEDKNRKLQRKNTIQRLFLLGILGLFLFSTYWVYRYNLQLAESEKSRIRAQKAKQSALKEKQQKTYALEITEKSEKQARSAEKRAEIEKQNALVEKQRAETAESKTRKAFEQSEKQKTEKQKIIDAFYFFKEKYALAKKKDYFYFIDKKGNPVPKFGKWDKAEQFKPYHQYYYGFVLARVEKDQEVYYLDTLGNIHSIANQLKDLNHETTILDLSESSFRNFPKQVCNYPKLQILRIGDQSSRTNQFEFLPPEITNLHELKVLEIINSNVTAIPKEIAQLKNLTRLYLSNNQLSKEEKDKVRKMLPNCNIVLKKIRRVGERWKAF